MKILIVYYSLYGHVFKLAQSSAFSFHKKIADAST